MTLPNNFWGPLHHGVYRTNLPHVQALEAWTDRRGTGPTTGHAAPPDALEERERVAALITTGHILRTALEHTLNRH